MIRSTCFGHRCAHHQELETTQVFTACGTWLCLWLVISVVCGCRLCVRVEGCCSSNYCVASSWSLSSYHRRCTDKHIKLIIKTVNKVHIIIITSHSAKDRVIQRTSSSLITDKGHFSSLRAVQTCCGAYLTSFSLDKAVAQ